MRSIWRGNLWMALQAAILFAVFAFLKRFAFNLSHWIECKTPATLRWRGPFVIFPDSGKTQKALVFPQPVSALAEAGPDIHSFGNEHLEYESRMMARLKVVA